MQSRSAQAMEGSKGMLLFFAVLAGILFGIFIPYNIPPSFTPFLAMGLLAACNTLFGGIAAQMHHKFDARTFVTGFFSNTILSMALTFAGTKLGVDFSLAAIVYFGTRIFNNLAKIQHCILQKGAKGVRIKEIGDRQTIRAKQATHATIPQDMGDDDTKQGKI